MLPGRVSILGPTYLLLSMKLFKVLYLNSVSGKVRYHIYIV